MTFQVNFQGRPLCKAQNLNSEDSCRRNDFFFLLQSLTNCKDSQFIARSQAGSHFIGILDECLPLSVCMLLFFFSLSFFFSFLGFEQ